MGEVVEGFRILHILHADSPLLFILARNHGFNETREHWLV